MASSSRPLHANIARAVMLLAITAIFLIPFFSAVVEATNTETVRFAVMALRRRGTPVTYVHLPWRDAWL